MRYIIIFYLLAIVIAIPLQVSADSGDFSNLPDEVIRELLRERELELHPPNGRKPDWEKDKEGARKYVKDLFGVKLLSAEVMPNDDFKKFMDVEYGMIRGLIIRGGALKKYNGKMLIDFDLYSTKNQFLARCELYFEDSPQLAQLAALDYLARFSGTPADPAHVLLKKFTLQNDVGDWDIIDSKEKKPTKINFLRKNTSVCIRLEDDSPTSLLEIAQAIDAVLLGKEQIDLSKQAANKLEAEQRKKREDEKREREEAAKLAQRKLEEAKQWEAAGKLSLDLEESLYEKKAEIEQARKWFKLPEGSQKLVLPNVTKGKVKLSMIQPYLPSKVTEGEEKQHEIYFNIIDEKGDEEGYVVLVYCSSQKQALDVMLWLKLAEGNPKGISESVEEKCRFMRLDTKSVGEMALTRVPELDENMNPITGTGESEVYFVRNNTAVAVRSIDPKQSLLKMAKAIDAVLKGK